jgi:hypothetical protein
MKFNDYIRIRSAIGLDDSAEYANILSQSSGVNGSMLIVWATGGSRCTRRPTCKELITPHMRSKLVCRR